ncbi:IclR family transcriptional regulator [Caballeronia sp. GAWG2-1]|uniref:IclR family transcriptional regulator n=1 Tax=Caballeronia sp. GAWG2-1 TaxID=2921744 RepID=UPI002027BB28|nr:IclR family transcriptional regulator [Caballeronia sp. GAWG2-1]
MHISKSRLSDREKPREKEGEEVTALARGLDVLRRIAAADAPVSNRELTEWTGIPKPTVSRITATLVGTGLLLRLPDSERFVLTASVLEFSNGFFRNFDIRARARPYLIALAEETGLSVQLAVRDQLEMVVIDAIRPRSAVLVLRLEVGETMDLTCTAMGRAYLSVLSQADRESLIGSLQIASGDDWPHIAMGLLRGVEDTHRNGFATSGNELQLGLNAIAAGFIGPSGERYSVNCSGAAHQCPEETLIETVAPALLRCVSQIAHEIAGTSGAATANIAMNATE